MIAEFDDPRLVAIYDAVNAYGPQEQPDFYGDLAARMRARTVIELGCGTGLITLELADRGYRMIGVDPSAEMLAVARGRPRADRIEWIDGGAEQIGLRNADLAFMAGHVAQFFLTDVEWLEALAALHRALRPGGSLAFESRNPDDRGWERWPAERHRFVDDPRAGRVETWWEFHDMHDEIASYTNHYRFRATGETLTSPARLRFRSLAELEATLAAAGFTVDNVFGNWDRSAVGPMSPELIVVAHR